MGGRSTGREGGTHQSKEGGGPTEHGRRNTGGEGGAGTLWGCLRGWPWLAWFARYVRPAPSVVTVHVCLSAYKRFGQEEIVFVNHVRTEPKHQI